MKLDELTIGDAKQLATMFGSGAASTHRWSIGQNYLLLVAGTFYTGRLVAVDDHEPALADAAWVADTGRFAEAPSSGVVGEVEPCPAGEALIGRGALVAAFRWEHDLPRSTK